jgi:hypothetical protein
MNDKSDSADLVTFINERIDLSPRRRGEWLTHRAQLLRIEEPAPRLLPKAINGKYWCDCGAKFDTPEALLDHRHPPGQSFWTYK